MENQNYYDYMKKHSSSQFTAKHTFNSSPEAEKFRNILVKHFLETMETHKTDYVYIPDIQYDYFETVFADHMEDPAIQRIEALYEYGYFEDSTGAKCKILDFLGSAEIL